MPLSHSVGPLPQEKNGTCVLSVGWDCFRQILGSGLCLLCRLPCLRPTRTPLNLLGAFVLIAAGTCIPTIAYAVQQKPASNSGVQPSSHNEEPGTAQTSQPSKEIQSCTQKAADKETWTQSDRSPLHAVYLSWQASTFPLIDGYNFYRYEVSEKPTRINSAPIKATNCIDSTVALGKTYYDVVEAVYRSGESVPQTWPRLRFRRGNCSHDEEAAKGK